MKTEKPIESQKEAEAVFAYLVFETMRVQKCSMEQAEKRINALYDSGILVGGHPDNPETQKKIDKFMSTQID